jgi:imidazolonepropionase-like amidohydrolase
MKERGGEEYQRANRAFEPLRRMVGDGVRLAAGTDAGINDTGYDGLATSLETMVGLGGMTPFDALRSATQIASEALGLDSLVGTLEVGKRADCIAVAGDPLRDLRALHRVKAVVKDGEIVDFSA